MIETAQAPQFEVTEVGNVWIASFEPLEITMVGLTRKAAICGLERAYASHTRPMRILPAISASEYDDCEACS